MRIFRAVGVLILTISLFGEASALDTEPGIDLESIAKITGLQYRAIQTAVVAVEQKFRQPLDLAEYRFIVLNRGDHILVGIVDAKKSEETLGISERVPEYSVETTSDGLAAIDVWREVD